MGCNQWIFQYGLQSCLLLMGMVRAAEAVTSAVVSHASEDDEQTLWCNKFLCVFSKISKFLASDYKRQSGGHCD